MRAEVRESELTRESGKTKTGRLLRIAAIAMCMGLRLGAADLKIAVQDGSNASIAGAVVTVRTTINSQTTSLITDQSGEVRFARLTPGAFVIDVKASKFGSTTQNVNLQEDAQPVVVHLNPENISTSVTVTESAYGVDTAPQASRLNLTALDTPQQTDTIPRKLMDDRAIVEVKDAVANAPGVYPAGTHGGQVSQFIIRGFADYSNLFRDGMRQVGTYDVMETADIENIEVLKGPEAALYGFGEPGGLINLVSKRPESDTHGTFSFQTGSFDYYRPTFDLTGPLTRSKKLFYRLNVAYQNSGSFRDFIGEARNFIAPSIKYVIGEHTQLFADFSYFRDNTPFDSGVTAYDDRPAPVPISLFLYGPGTLNKQTTYRGAARLEHQFTSHMSIRSSFSGIDNWDRRNRGFAAGDYDPATNSVPRGYDFSLYGFRDYISQTDFLAQFSTGRLQHNFLAGGEFYHDGAPYLGADGDILPLNLSTLNYGPLPSYAPLTNYGSFVTNMGGFYFQDLITLSRRWKVGVGGRQNIYRNYTLTPEGTHNNSPSANPFSPRVALLYQPLSNVSIYGNWSRSFAPNSGIDFNGRPFAPEFGDAWEAGVKSQLPGRFGMVTAAVFDITKINVLTTDPAHPNFSILSGEQRSKGVEINYTGQPLPGWNLLVGYAWDQAQITKDNVQPIGAFLMNVPRHGVNLWSTYRFQQRSLKNLSLGAGLYSTSSRFGDNENTVLLPGYARVDASASYDIVQHDRLRSKLSLNLINALDRQYYLTAQFRQAIFPGAPRTIMGTWKWMF